MKMMAMRRVVELRTEKQKPNLKNLMLGGLHRMTARERQAKRKQFMHIFGRIEEQHRQKESALSEE